MWCFNDAVGQLQRCGDQFNEPFWIVLSINDFSTQYVIVFFVGMAIKLKGDVESCYIDRKSWTMACV